MFGRRVKKLSKSEDREPGVSTEPGASFLDQVQKEEESQPVSDAREVSVDHDAVELLDPATDPEPKQVEESTVIFVPRKDFEARVNQEVFPFRKGIRTRVTRDVANMLTEDDERGYIL